MFWAKSSKEIATNKYVGWNGVEGVVGMRLGVGCPCPPFRNDIVTPRHLFIFEYCLVN